MRLSKPLILASNSPRRKEIMQNAGYEFTVKVIPTDEIFSADMHVEEVPVYLACTKAECFRENLQNEIILCADTVVIIDQENKKSTILNKPSDQSEAKEMLRMLSGHVHRVITGVCIMTSDETVGFADTSACTPKSDSYKYMIDASPKLVIKNNDFNVTSANSIAGGYTASCVSCGCFDSAAEAVLDGLMISNGNQVASTTSKGANQTAFANWSWTSVNNKF